MSDANRREVERRAHAGGAFADRVALLRERVRAGVLGLDRLRLAAYLGDEAAAEALAGAPRVVEGAGVAAVVEVADDAGFARMVEAERAVGMIYSPWSGPAHLHRRRLTELHARVLGGLVAEVSVFVLHAEVAGPSGASAPDERSALIRWLRSQTERFAPYDPLSSGAGELWWARRRQVVRTAHPAALLETTDFVRVTVEALGLGMDDA